MTTIEDLYKKFNVPEKQRGGPKFQAMDIGNYNFTDMIHIDPFVWDFINDDENVIFRIHEDRRMLLLFKKTKDGLVDVHRWIFHTEIIEEDDTLPDSKIFDNILARKQ